MQLKVLPGKQPSEMATRGCCRRLSSTRIASPSALDQARDLFDLEIALTRLPVEPRRIVAAFLEYMLRDGHLPKPPNNIRAILVLSAG